MLCHSGGTSNHNIRDRTCHSSSSSACINSCLQAGSGARRLAERCRHRRCRHAAHAGGSDELQGLTWSCDAFKKQVNPTTLAFLGDAVWALHVRSHQFVPPKRISMYHIQVKHHVTAEGQAAHHDALLASSALTPPELELLAWARDYPGMSFRERFASQEQLMTYRKATALEALVGYLHLTDTPRLLDVLRIMLP